MEIKSVQVFECSICEKTSKDQAVIEACQKKCESAARKKLLEKKRNEAHLANMDKVRLEANSPEDIKKLLIKYAKEFFDAELTFTEFRLNYKADVSAYHSSPYTEKGRKKDTYPGYVGRVSGSIKFKNGEVKIKGERYNSFNDIIGNVWGKQGFTGLRTKTGGGGPNGWSYDMTIFIQDFPQIAARHEEYLKMLAIKGEHHKFLNRKHEHDSKVAAKIRTKDAQFLKILEIQERHRVYEQMIENAKRDNERAKYQREREIYQQAQKESKIKDQDPGYDKAEFDKLQNEFRGDYW